MVQGRRIEDFEFSKLHYVAGEDKMSRMKIGIYHQALDVFAGGERVTANVANLLSLKFDVYLINSYLHHSVYNISNKINNVFLHNEKKRLRYTFFNDIKKLRRTIIDYNIDILIMVGFSGTPLIAYISSFALPCKIVYWEQSTINRYNLLDEYKEKKLYYTISQWLINRFSDKIIVLTDKEKENYICNYHISDNKIAQIYNYYTSDLYNPNIKYCSKAKKIVTVANVDPIKGYDLLIDVANIVFSQDEEWSWEIFGDYKLNNRNVYYSKLQDKIKSFGLENRLIFKGASNNIFNEYKNYGIYVSTSLCEGFGMTLLEARLNKLPLVSFDIKSGPSDIIDNNLNGFLVKDESIKEMALVLLKLMHDEDLRIRLSKMSYEGIDKFNENSAVEKWENLLTSL